MYDIAGPVQHIFEPSIILLHLTLWHFRTGSMYFWTIKKSISSPWNKKGLKESQNIDTKNTWQKNINFDLRDCCWAYQKWKDGTRTSQMLKFLEVPPFVQRQEGHLPLVLRKKTRSRSLLIVNLGMITRSSMMWNQHHKWYLQSFFFKQLNYRCFSEEGLPFPSCRLWNFEIASSKHLQLYHKDFGKVLWTGPIFSYWLFKAFQNVHDAN